MYDFDDIRCFGDSDVPAHLPAIADEPHIHAALKMLCPDLDIPSFVAQLKSMTTVEQFQTQAVAPFVLQLAQRSCASLSLDHTELLTPHAATYITNHRDIVLDSAFLNTLLVQYGRKTAEIAIGDNLLIFPWIKDLVRLNKSFIVKRDVPMRQMLEVSRKLSAYVHHTISDKDESIWIAQREGRSKDCSDCTQAAVIKMLALGGPSRNIVESVMALNLQPVALSYEYDPCDYLKARELQMRRDDSGWHKTQQEDLTSMATGMFGQKGRVVFNVTPPLNPEFAQFPSGMDKNAQVNAICQTVDAALHRGMTLFEINYVAYDLRFSTTKYAAHYTEQQRKEAITYLNGQMAKIDLPNRDEDFLWEKLLTMYSNPVLNKEELA